MKKSPLLNFCPSLSCRPTGNRPIQSILKNIGLQCGNTTTSRDRNDWAKDRTGWVTSVLRTEMTEDRTDWGPKWMRSSVLGPNWLRTEVTKDRSGCRAGWYIQLQFEFRSIRWRVVVNIACDRLSYGGLPLLTSRSTVFDRLEIGLGNPG